MHISTQREQAVIPTDGSILVEAVGVIGRTTAFMRGSIGRYPLDVTPIQFTMIRKLDAHPHCNKSATQQLDWTSSRSHSAGLVKTAVSPLFH